MAYGTASRRSSGIAAPQTEQVPYVPASMPRERLVDLGDHVVGVLAERLIELEVDEIRGVIGDVLVAGGGVDLAHALVIGREVDGGADDALAQAAAALRAARARSIVMTVLSGQTRGAALPPRA